MEGREGGKRVEKLQLFSQILYTEMRADGYSNEILSKVSSRGALHGSNFRSVSL